MVRAAVAENVADPVARSGAPQTRQGARALARRGRRRWLLATALVLAGGALASGALVLRREPDTAAAHGAIARTGTPRTGTPRTGTPRTGTPRTGTPRIGASAPRFHRPVGVDRSLFPLAVHRVVVDAGHGGADFGASGSGLAEKNLTLDIAKRLRARLEAGGFHATMTRGNDRRLSLRERVQHANQAHADLFISVHINWFDLPAIRGVETYYLGATEDPELMALAQRENRESGYALGDLRQLLDGVYADLRQDESRRLASRVQRSLYRSLLPVSPELRDRGVKTAPFVVLVATEMPAILAEVSCLSNAHEAERLARPRYRDHIADALYAGIESYARDVNQTVEKGS